MTDTEFTTFQEQHLYVAMPSVERWLAEVHDTLATLALWREVLRPYTLEECASVVRRWAAGELDPPKAYDRDLLAACIKAVVDKDRSKLRGKIQPAEAEQPRVRHGVSPIAPIVAEAIKLKKRGMSDAELEAFIESKVAGSEYNQARYDCHLCRDSGLVEVWRTRVAYSVDQGSLDSDDAAGAFMVACSCDAGERYKEGTSHFRPLPAYDANQFCRHHGDSSDRQRLVEWLNARKRHVEFEVWGG